LDSTRPGWTSCCPSSPSILGDNRYASISGASMYDVVIVGAGPAGLAAAVYGARKRLDVILVSQNTGGQMNRTAGVENYLGYQFIEGAELVSKFESQIAQYPLKQRIGVNVLKVSRIPGGFEVILDDGTTERARTVVFAGGKRPRELGVQGERQFAGRGVSYCAVCDGPVFAGQRVAVVGGGNSALEATLDMVKIAEHVDVVAIDGLTGDQVMIEKVQAATNVSLHLKHAVESIEGAELVEAIGVKSLETGERLRLAVSGVFVEIGLIPNSEPLKDLLELNHRGEVPINCMSETAVPGLFAAGDVSDVPEKQIIIAAGEGAKAMLEAHRYLQRSVAPPA
jgi:NADH-dependent peroxiredoxin subunit F